MFFWYSFVVSILRKIGISKKRNLSYYLLVTSLLNDSDNETILDIGTGTGYIARMLSRKRKRFVVGLDIDRHVLKSNKPRLFHRVVADAHQMPFKSATFDTILFISCVEHLKRPFVGIQEISRITKQNGLCIAQLPNLQWFMEPHTKFPFLYFFPRWFSSIFKKSSGYGSLNLDATLGRVLSWFNRSGFRHIIRRKIYHGLAIFRILPWPLGWFLAFRKQQAHFAYSKEADCARMQAHKVNYYMRREK